MTSNAQPAVHHRSVYGVTLENVREPRVKASALNSSTRTMTRNPSVATATKCPDRRISTRPTSQATPLTSDRRDQRRREEPEGERADDLVEVDAGDPAREVRQVGRLLGERQGQDRRGVGTERHEPDLAEREHAGEAAGQVEADREDHEDPEVDHQALPERLAARVEDGEGDRGQGDDEDGSGRPAPRRDRGRRRCGAHRSPWSRLPRMPCGRTSRTRIRTTNTTASR